MIQRRCDRCYAIITNGLIAGQDASSPVVLTPDMPYDPQGNPPAGPVTVTMAVRADSDLCATCAGDAIVAFGLAVFHPNADAAYSLSNIIDKALGVTRG